MRWTLLTTLLLTVSCAQQATTPVTVKSGKPGGATTVTPPAPVPTSGSGDGEGVSIPSGITGALLRCAALSDASNEIPTSQIGCRLSDAAGKRIDPSSLGVKAAFTTSAVPAGIKVTQRTPLYVARSFDSIFDLTGASKDAVTAALASMKYEVSMKAIIGDDALGSKSSTFAQSKIEPRRADWVSYLYGSSPTYVDQATSLVWALDDGKGYTLEEGRVHCNDLIYADSSDWRLPTAVEMRTAHLNGLGVAYADGGNMNIDSKRFAGYGTSTLEFPDQVPVIGMSRRWSIDLGPANGANLSLGPVEDRKSVICVHE